MPQHLEDRTVSGVTLVLSGLGAVSNGALAPCRRCGSDHWCGIILGLAVLSALITFFFITPLTRDGMEKEDAAVIFLSQTIHGLTCLHFSCIVLITVPCIPGRKRV